MFRYLIIFAFVYFVYRIFRSVILGTPKKPDMARTQEGEDMVRDPNCNTYISLKSAIVGNIKGKSYYFCSKECEKEYRDKL